MTSLARYLAIALDLSPLAFITVMTVNNVCMFTLGSLWRTKL